MKKNIYLYLFACGLILFSGTGCKKEKVQKLQQLQQFQQPVTPLQPTSNSPTGFDAGRDTTILIPKNSVTFTPTVNNASNDNELLWRKISGPSSIVMDDLNGRPYQKGLSAQAIWLEEGVYEFELRDIGPSIKDTVKVTITTELRKYVVTNLKSLRSPVTGFTEIQLPEAVFKDLKWVFCRSSSRCEQADAGPLSYIDYNWGGWYYLLNNNKFSLFGGYSNEDFDLILYY